MHAELWGILSPLKWKRGSATASQRSSPLTLRRFRRRFCEKVALEQKGQTVLFYTVVNKAIDHIQTCRASNKLSVDSRRINGRAMGLAAYRHFSAAINVKKLSTFC